MDINQYNDFLGNWTSSSKFRELPEADQQQSLKDFNSQMVAKSPELKDSINRITEDRNVTFLRGSGKGRIIPNVDVVFPNQEKGYELLSKEDKLDKINGFRDKIEDIAKSNPTQRDDTRFALKASADMLERRVRGEDSNLVVDAYSRAVEGALGTILDSMGLESAGDSVRNYMPDNPDRDDSIIGKIASTYGSVVGSILPIIAVGLATDGLGAPAMATRTATSVTGLLTNGTLRYGEAYKNAIESGLDDSKASDAGWAAVPAAAIDMFADTIIAGKFIPTKAIRPLATATTEARRGLLKGIMADNTIRRKMTDWAVAGLSEGISESYGDYFAASRAYSVTGDSSHMPTGGQSVESFLLGALAGSTLPASADIYRLLGSKKVAARFIDESGKQSALKDGEGKQVYRSYPNQIQRNIAESFRNVSLASSSDAADVMRLIDAGKYTKAYKLSSKIAKNQDLDISGRSYEAEANDIASQAGQADAYASSVSALDLDSEIAAQDQSIQSLQDNHDNVSSESLSEANNLPATSTRFASTVDPVDADIVGQEVSNSLNKINDLRGIGRVIQSSIFVANAKKNALVKRRDYINSLTAVSSSTASGNLNGVQVAMPVSPVLSHAANPTQGGQTTTITVPSSKAPKGFSAVSSPAYNATQTAVPQVAPVNSSVSGAITSPVSNTNGGRFTIDDTFNDVTNPSYPANLRWKLLNEGLRTVSANSVITGGAEESTFSPNGRAVTFSNPSPASSPAATTQAIQSASPAVGAPASPAVGAPENLAPVTPTPAAPQQQSSFQTGDTPTSSTGAGDAQTLSNKSTEQSIATPPSAEFAKQSPTSSNSWTSIERNGSTAGLRYVFAGKSYVEFFPETISSKYGKEGKNKIIGPKPKKVGVIVSSVNWSTDSPVISGGTEFHLPQDLVVDNGKAAVNEDVTENPDGGEIIEGEIVDEVSPEEVIETPEESIQRTPAIRVEVSPDFSMAEAATSLGLQEDQATEAIVLHPERFTPERVAIAKSYVAPYLISKGLKELTEIIGKYSSMIAESSMTARQAADAFDAHIRNGLTVSSDESQKAIRDLSVAMRDYAELSRIKTNLDNFIDFLDRGTLANEVSSGEVIFIKSQSFLSTEYSGKSENARTSYPVDPFFGMLQDGASMSSQFIDNRIASLSEEQKSLASLIRKEKDPFRKKVMQSSLKRLASLRKRMDNFIEFRDKSDIPYVTDSNSNFNNAIRQAEAIHTYSVTLELSRSSLGEAIDRLSKARSDDYNLAPERARILVLKNDVKEIIRTIDKANEQLTKYAEAAYVDALKYAESPGSPSAARLYEVIGMPTEADANFRFPNYYYEQPNLRQDFVEGDPSDPLFGLSPSVLANSAPDIKRMSNNLAIDAFNLDSGIAAMVSDLLALEKKRNDTYNRNYKRGALSSKVYTKISGMDNEIEIARSNISSAGKRSRSMYSTANRMARLFEFIMAKNTDLTENRKAFRDIYNQYKNTPKLTNTIVREQTVEGLNNELGEVRKQFRSTKDIDYRAHSSNGIDSFAEWVKSLAERGKVEGDARQRIVPAATQQESVGGAPNVTPSGFTEGASTQASEVEGGQTSLTPAPASDKIIEDNGQVVSAGPPVGDITSSNPQGTDINQESAVTQKSQKVVGIPPTDMRRDAREVVRNVDLARRISDLKKQFAENLKGLQRAAGSVRGKDSDFQTPYDAQEFSTIVDRVLHDDPIGSKEASFLISKIESFNPNIRFVFFNSSESFGAYVHNGNYALISSPTKAAIMDSLKKAVLGSWVSDSVAVESRVGNIRPSEYIESLGKSVLTRVEDIRDNTTRSPTIKYFIEAYKSSIKRLGFKSLAGVNILGEEGQSELAQKEFAGYFTSLTNFMYGYMSDANFRSEIKSNLSDALDLSGRSIDEVYIESSDYESLMIAEALSRAAYKATGAYTSFRNGARYSAVTLANMMEHDPEMAASMEMNIGTLKAIAETNPDIRIAFRQRLGSGELGHYSPLRNRIELTSLDGQTFRHELAHSITARELSNLGFKINSSRVESLSLMHDILSDELQPPEIRDLMGAFLHSAEVLGLSETMLQSNRDSNIKYAFSSIHEFVAAALEGGKVSRELAAIEYKGETVLKKIKDAVNKFISKFFFYDQSYVNSLSDRSVLSTVMAAVNHLQESSFNAESNNTDSGEFGTFLKIDFSNQADEAQQQITELETNIRNVSRGRITDKIDSKTRQIMQILRDISNIGVNYIPAEMTDATSEVVNNIIESRTAGIDNPSMRYVSDNVIRVLKAVHGAAEQNAIDDTIQRYENLIDFDDPIFDYKNLSELRSQINDWAMANDFNEMERRDRIAEGLKDRVQKLYESWRKEFTATRDEFIANNPTFDDYLGGVGEMESSGVIEMLRDSYDHLTTVDTSTLEGKELYNKFFAINNMNDGTFSGLKANLGYIADKRNKEENVESLRGIFRDPRVSRNKFLAGVDSLNSLAEIHQVKLGRLSALTEGKEWVQNGLLGRLHTAINSESMNRKTRLMKRWTDAIRQYEEKTGREFGTDDTVALSILGRLSQYREGRDVNSEFRMQFAKEMKSINNKIINSTGDRALFRERIQLIFHKITEDIDLDSDTVMEDFMSTIQSRAALDESADVGVARVELLGQAQDIFAEFETESRIIAEGLYGRKFERVINYMTNDTNSAVEDYSSDFDKALDNEYDKNGSGLTFTPGHFHDRSASLGDKEYFSYNISSTVERNIERLSVASSAMPEMFVIKERLRSGSDLDGIISVDSNNEYHASRIPFLKKATVDVVKNATSRGEPLDYFSRGLRFATSMYARTVLSSPHHLITQPLATLVDYAGRTKDGKGWIKAASYYTSNREKVDKWFEDNSAWTAMRSALEAQSLDTRRTPTDDSQELMSNHPFAKALSKIYKKSGKYLTIGLHIGDDYSVKATIIADYIRRLKEKGYNIDGPEDLENTLVEHDLLTQSIMDSEKIVNTSNKIFRGALFSDRSALMSNVRNLTVAFASHSSSLATQVNQAIRDVAELKALGGNEKEIQDRMVTIGSIVAQQFVFTSARYIFGAAVAAPMLGLVGGLFHDDDDEIEKAQLRVDAAREDGDPVRIAYAEQSLLRAKSIAKMLKKSKHSTLSLDGYSKQVIRDITGTFNLVMNNNQAQQILFAVPDKFFGKMVKSYNDEKIGAIKSQMDEAVENEDRESYARLLQQHTLLSAAEYIPLAYDNVSGSGISGLYGSLADSYKRTYSEFSKGISGESEWNYNDFLLAGSVFGFGQSEFNKFLNAIDKIEDKVEKSRKTFEAGKLKRAQAKALEE